MNLNVLRRDLTNRLLLLTLGDDLRSKLSIFDVIARLYLGTLAHKITRQKGRIFENKNQRIYNGNKEHQLKLNGLHLHLKPNHVLILLKEVFIDNEYELPKLEANSTALDVGANIGLFSILLAKKNPSTTIYAYEPEKENFKLLVKNINANRLDNIIPINKGISGKKGELKLYIHESLTHSANNPTDTFELIDVEKFDDAVAKIKPELIKMDIEGHEYEALLGQELVYMPKYFLIELHEVLPLEKQQTILEKLNKHFAIHFKKGGVHLFHKN